MRLKWVKGVTNSNGIITDIVLIDIKGNIHTIERDKLIELVSSGKVELTNKNLLNNHFEDIREGEINGKPIKKIINRAVSLGYNYRIKKIYNQVFHILERGIDCTLLVPDDIYDYIVR